MILRLSMIAQFAHAGVPPQRELFKPGSLFWVCPATAIPYCRRVAGRGKTLLNWIVRSRLMR
jgi:hypothetical protein